MIPHYTIPHERIGLAMECLTIPVESTAHAVACAMAELSLAFREHPAPTEARPFLHDIEYLMAGPESWEERAARLGEEDLRRLARAFRGLDRLLTRLYYEALHGVKAHAAVRA